MGTATDIALAQVELQAEIGSTVTLTSAPANLPALAPLGAPYTPFTGEMIRQLRRGGLEEGQPLTLEALYGRLISTAAIQQLPQPQMRGTGTAGELTFTRIGKQPYSQAIRRDGRAPHHRLIGAVLSDNGSRAGTCFQISSGVLVTAWHILDDICNSNAEVGRIVQVEPLTGGTAFDCQIKSLDQKHNIAVLRFNVRIAVYRYRIG